MHAMESRCAHLERFARKVGLVQPLHLLQAGRESAAGNMLDARGARGLGGAGSRAGQVGALWAGRGAALGTMPRLACHGLLSTLAPSWAMGPPQTLPPHALAALSCAPSCRLASPTTPSRPEPPRHAPRAAWRASAPPAPASPGWSRSARRHRTPGRWWRGRRSRRCAPAQAGGKMTRGATRAQVGRRACRCCSGGGQVGGRTCTGVAWARSSAGCWALLGRGVGCRAAAGGLAAAVDPAASGCSCMQVRRGHPARTRAG